MKAIHPALVLLTLCSLAVIDARPAASEIYRPWCAQYYGVGSSGTRNCGFVSYEQCMMTAGPGTGGSCVQNPWYLWYGPNSPSTTGRGGRARR